MRHKEVVYLLLAVVFFSCSKEEEATTMQDPELKFSVAFDSTLARLGNLGQEVDVAVGNAAQHPLVNEVSLHYIELAPDSLTWLGDGEVVYQGMETAEGGDFAVDFDRAPKGGNGEELVRLKLEEINPGTYEWVRVSLTYQNLDIEYRLNVDPWIENEDFTGTMAAFVGFNTYIGSHTISDSVLIVNENKLQGYWAFETGIAVSGQTFGQVWTGDGAGVTVVNPLFASSPVPPGSCVLTGKLAEPLVISGSETEDIEVVLTFCTNNSVEWIDIVADGKFEPGAGETLVDMGLRGLHPSVQ